MTSRPQAARWRGQAARGDLRNMKRSGSKPDVSENHHISFFVTPEEAPKARGSCWDLGAEEAADEDEGHRPACPHAAAGLRSKP